MTFRTLPHPIKVYEALGAIADGRVEINDAGARVFSSSLNKQYTVSFDESSRSLMSNDNGSYYVGYLGYPSISYLMMVGYLPFSEKYASALEGIAWKDMNQSYDNDFDLAQKEVHRMLLSEQVDLVGFLDYIQSVLMLLEEEPFGVLGEKVLPPEGY